MSVAFASVVGTIVAVTATVVAVGAGTVTLGIVTDVLASVVGSVVVVTATAVAVGAVALGTVTVVRTVDIIGVPISLVGAPQATMARRPIPMLKRRSR